MNEALILLLFMIGLWLLIMDPHVIRKVIGLGFMNNAVVLLFVLRGASAGTTIAILTTGTENIVDPLPQALMLTAIVIGVCITALALSLSYNLYLRYGTFEIDEIRSRTEHDTE